MSPHSESPSLAARAASAARVGFALLAAVSIAGLMAINIGSPANAADDSTLTVKWLGDSGNGKAFQPNRHSSGFEYDEFKNISISVQQTKNLVDQAVVVSVSGFASGTQRATDGVGNDWTDAKNFMQAMQCWGDPASADFRNTCEWGGKNVANNGLGKSVFNDNVLRVSPRDASPSTDKSRDVPFTSVTGDSVTARYEKDATTGNYSYPLLGSFGPSTTNEVSSARIKSDGTGTFDFQMQTSNTAPQLGCGSPTHLRCWLVLIPRGTVFGGDGQNCSSALKSDLTPYSLGEQDAIQGGSPVNTQCQYWDNRIVVPLDFNPITSACPGGAEQRVVGAQLLISAFSSWQPKLCTAANGAYSFASNPDSVARDQLLDKNTQLAFSSYPIVRKDLDTDVLKDEFDVTTLSYAPVAIGALTLSYYAEGPAGRITTLRLTPRLVAKLLTQSYAFEVPGSTSEGNGQSNLGVVNRSYRLMADDPDFRDANPDWSLYRTNPSLVLPGPSGADAIAQLWKWVQSDADARDFLNGKPDPWKMTINPYFLPAGNSAAVVPQYDDTNTLVVDALGQPVLKPVGLSFADGSPLALASTAIDYFPLADQNEVPHALTGGIRTRINSLDWLPYSNDFPSSAVKTFRADPGARIVWDPNAIDPAGDSGAWVSPGPQLPGQRFVIAVTDLASSVQYDLSVAQLGVANATSFVSPTSSTMSAAVTSGLKATTSSAVKQIDPTSVVPDAYPLTTVVYAITNLTASTKAQLQTYSAMLTFVTGDGQIQGSQPGQLPAGYLPLTSDMVSQTRAAATAMLSYTPPVLSTYSGSNDGASYSSASSYPAGAASDRVVGEPADPAISSLAEVPSTGRTPVVASTPANSSLLAISLAVGLFGAIFSPVLLRGRRQW